MNGKLSLKFSFIFKGNALKKFLSGLHWFKKDTIVLLSQQKQVLVLLLLGVVEYDYNEYREVNGGASLSKCVFIVKFVWSFCVVIILIANWEIFFQHWFFTF